MRRSPSRFVRVPANGEEMNRIRANAETTAEAAKAVTPKDSAKIGIDGITMPKPSATKKAMLAKTATSTGRSLSSGRR